MLAWLDWLEEEHDRCIGGRDRSDPAAGFEYWCRKYCKVQDESIKRDVPFAWWAGQARIVPDLVAGKWLCILKGRQLGVTVLCAAYVTWRLTFEPRISCLVVNQDKDYAAGFVDRVRDMVSGLPGWMRKLPTTRQVFRLRFERGENRGDLRAVAGTAKTARSVTADLLIIDEASRVDFLSDVLQAAIPSLEKAGGQIIQLSTSAGPSGPFYSTWRDTYGDSGELLAEGGVSSGGYVPIFLHWSEAPGRDQAWYDREKTRLDKISAVAIKQEHPNDPQEAWEFAAGRVYPLFSREQHVGHIDVPTTAAHYRAIDWGQSESAQVCLWLAHIPGNPGLIVAPECSNTIREMILYRWDEDRTDKVLKKDDHCPDCIRMAVATFRLTGLVYVYRETYVTDSVAKGWNPMREIEDVHERSGWRKSHPREFRTRRWVVGRDGQLYDGTVADRSWPKMIAMYNQHHLHVRAHEAPKRKQRGSGGPGDQPASELEVKEGIRCVSALVDGSIRIDELIEVRRSVNMGPRRGPSGEKVASKMADRLAALEQLRVGRRRMKKRARR